MPGWTPLLVPLPHHRHGAVQSPCRNPLRTYRFREDRARAKIYRGYRTFSEIGAPTAGPIGPTAALTLARGAAREVVVARAGRRRRGRGRLRPGDRRRRPDRAADRRARRTTDRHAPALPARGQPRLRAGSGAGRCAASGGGPRLSDRRPRPHWPRIGSLDDRRGLGRCVDGVSGVVAIVVTVQIENRRSWRALEKAGYRRTWSGFVHSGDPSDDGPSHVYVLDRPSLGQGAGTSNANRG